MLKMRVNIHRDLETYTVLRGLEVGGRRISEFSFLFLVLLELLLFP